MKIKDYRIDEEKNKIGFFKKSWPIFAFLANSLIVPIIYVLVLMLIGVKDINDYMGYTEYIAAIINIAIILGAIKYYKKVGLDLFKKSDFEWWYLLLIVGVFAINNVQSIILQQIFDQNTTMNGNALIENMKANLVFSLISAIIIAPIIEEIVFRGVFMNIVFKNKAVVGLLVTSVFFSLMHMPTDLFSFFNYFNMAIAFGLVFKLSNNNLKVSIGAHMFNNALSMGMVVIQYGFLK